MRIFLIIVIFYTSLNVQGQMRYGPEFEFRHPNQFYAGTSCMLALHLLHAAYYYSSDDYDFHTYISVNFAMIMPLSVMLVPFCSGYALSKRIETLANKIANLDYYELHKSEYRGEPSYRFVDKRGWSFRLTQDADALEVLADPVTTDQYKGEIGERLQKQVFDLAEESGFHVHRKTEYFSQGHINLDLNFFKENPLLLRNFIVDQLNHSEFANGVLSNDQYNAESLVKSSKKRNKIAKIIQSYDEAESRDITVFMKELNSLFHKMSQLGLRHTVDNKTSARIEVRAHRAQRDMNEFIKLIDLYDGRLEYLMTLKSPIEFENKAVEKDPKKQLIRFRNYVEESQKNFNDFYEILPEKYQQHFCSTLMSS